MTYTYVFLGVSEKCYNEIRARLENADYFQAFHKTDDGREVIDMHGIALRVLEPQQQEGKEKPVTRWISWNSVDDTFHYHTSEDENHELEAQDFYAAHDEVVERFGICPANKDGKCTAKCERPDWVKEREAIADDPMRGLPLSELSNLGDVEVKFVERSDEENEQR